MPAAVRDAIASFVADHHVEHIFEKRKRDRADPEALARAVRGPGATMSETRLLSRDGPAAKRGGPWRRATSDAGEADDAAGLEAPVTALAAGETRPSFDPASLPPLESIGTGSDIKAFLAAGVPAE